MKLLAPILVLLALAVPAKADTVYTYSGNSPQTAACTFGCPSDNFGSSPINGQFVLFGTPVISEMPIAVDPLAYFFSAGNQIFDQNNSTAYFEIGTNALGDIDDWLFSASNQTGGIFSEYYGSTFEATDEVSQNNSTTMYLQGDPGTWLVVDPPSQPAPPIVPTPEPSSILMSGIGAVGVLLAARFLGKQQKRCA